MNIAFSKILKIQDRQWEFNFRKIPASYISYHVDFTDEKGARVIFSLYQTPDKTWRITSSKIPLWLVSVENLLGETIEEYEKENTSKKKV